MPNRPYNRPALFLAAALFTLLIALLAATLADSRSLRTAAILPTPTPQPSLTSLLHQDEGPALISNRLSFRATLSQAEALHKALRGQPVKVARSRQGTPTAAPVTYKPLTRSQRVASARRAIPALRKVPFRDITPIVPSARALSELHHNVSRWFTLTLTGKEQEVPITQTDPKNPLAIAARAPDKAEDAPTPSTVPSITTPGAAYPLPPEQLISASPSPSPTPNPAHVAAVSRIQNVASTLQSAQVELTEPVYVVRAFGRTVPNDPYYHSTGSWGQPYDDLWGLKKMRLEEAWDTTTGSPDVTVAVVDTGVDYTHPDLKENMWENPGETGLDAQGKSRTSNGLDDDNNGYVDDWRGWDFASNDNDPMDDGGHGTHVAGTIAAVGNNSRDITGVMWQANIAPVKIFDGDIGGDDKSSQALLYAATMGARVINNSWGGLPHYPSQIKIPDTIAYIQTNYPQAVVVAAAGNAGLEGLLSPASIEGVLSVGASTPQDERAPFSSYGSTLGVTAPGGGAFLNQEPIQPVECNNTRVQNILSLAPRVFTEFSPCMLLSTTTGRLAGTSMATPHVSGLAGLIASIHTGWTGAQIIQRILDTADDIGPAPGRDDETGHGRINAARAINGSPPAPYVRLTAPRFGTHFNSRNIIEISGSITSAEPAAYTVEVGQGWTPVQWSTQGVVQTSTDQVTNITNSILAHWNPDSVSEAGFYTIRLVVKSASALPVERRVTIYIDPSMRAGWPQPLFNAPGKHQPVIGNVDNDPEREIIVVSEFGHIAVFNHDGSRISGWPENISADESLYVTFGPIAADVNQDRTDDIMIVAEDYRRPRYTIHAFTKGGAQLPGWPVSVPETFADGTTLAGAPAVADINGDGRGEVVAITYAAADNSGVANSSEQGMIHAWDHTGQEIDGWPKAFTIPPSPWTQFEESGASVVVDSDNDGEKNLIARVSGDRPFADEDIVLNMAPSGTASAGWPFHFKPPSDEDKFKPFLNGVPVVGNVVGDEKAEIVIVRPSASSRSSPTSEIVVVSHDGRILEPWPQEIPVNTIGASVLLHDLDGDGRQEIIIGRLAYQGDSRRVAGWETWLDQHPGIVGSEITMQSSLAADVTGDGISEVIMRDNFALLEDGTNDMLLHAYNQLGKDAPGWLKLLPGENRPDSGMTVAADLDQDGTIEVATATITHIGDAGGEEIRGFLTVYNTPGLASAGEWPQLHKDAQHSRGYLPPSTPSDTTPPAVTRIRVGSTSWSPEFRAAVDPSAKLGYPIPTGENQLKPLPWSNINQIFIEFSEDIGTLPSNLVALTGVTQGSYPNSSVSYDSTTYTATLTLTAPLGIDRLWLNLSDQIKDLAGNALDGEWTDGVSTESGDGTAGGSFTFRFNVLPGDVNQSGSVATNDMGPIRSGLGQKAEDEKYSIFADLNGSGSIAVDDVSALRRNLGKSLP